MIFKYNNLMVSYFEEIEISNLAHSKVWYEYYVPSEYEYLNKLGFTDEWLDSKFLYFKNVELETHVKYALISEEFLKTEFTYIGCGFMLNNEILLPGFAFKIINEINAISIFFNNKKYDFGNGAVFGSENLETFKNLYEIVTETKQIEPIHSVELVFDQELIDFYKLPGSFQICNKVSS